MVYKSVRGWTSGWSLSILNFVKYPGGHFKQGSFSVLNGKSNLTLSIIIIEFFFSTRKMLKKSESFAGCLCCKGHNNYWV